MKNLSFKYTKCNDIIDTFGEDAVEQRFNELYSQLQTFVKQNKLESVAKVNKILLANAIIDYYCDIKRLINFHTDVKKINSEKVIAYTSYWLLQRKVIQFIDDDFQKDLATLNERFVLQLILDYLSDRERGAHILLRENIGLQNFAKLLLYYLIYRKYDAQSLEMVITSFMAGQIYERIDEDISEELHPFDNK